MVLTEHGIKRMGFKEIPEGMRIEAIFNSVFIYSVEGIRLDELGPEFCSDLSYEGEDYSFSFGNSINEIFRGLLNEDFIEDEAAWQEKNGDNAPYFVIHFKIKEPFICSSGYWQRMEGNLLTYNCFPEAKQAIKDLENKIIPSLILSLTVQLSEIGKAARFNLIDHGVYAKTNENETLVDIHVKSTARGCVSRSISEIKNKVAEALKQYSRFEPKVATLLYSALTEKDKLRKFLSLYQSLEIHIHKTFAQINFKKHVDDVSSYPERLNETSREFFIQRHADSKTLTQRFIWCAMLQWDKIKDLDVKKFKEIKKSRDRLSHGEQISESSLPINDLENLLFKVL